MLIRIFLITTKSMEIEWIAKYFHALNFRRSISRRVNIYSTWRRFQWVRETTTTTNSIDVFFSCASSSVFAFGWNASSKLVVQSERRKDIFIILIKENYCARFHVESTDLWENGFCGSKAMYSISSSVAFDLRKCQHVREIESAMKFVFG